MKKSLYWILSLTWGLPMSIAGLATLGIMRLRKHEVKHHKNALYMSIGHNWGGVNLGCVFFVDKENEHEFDKNHEYGHSIQNIIYGPLTPFIVGLPSLIRATYRTILEKFGKKFKTDYYDIWFEAQANYFGGKF